MNKEQFVGICLQLAGKVKQTWGGWTGDTRQEALGRRQQLSGKAQQDNGIEREQADRQLKDFHDQHRNWYF
ncbi:MAG: CsbD family protein [Rhodocyclales bacterium]|nr:CsbD family protein [Rhodocyclales bacterium]